ncbi:unnamed protein product, partial [marine sediment metagenome]
MSSNLEKTTVTFREAVKLYACRNKNSAKTLEKLLKHFSISQVAKLIRTLSSEWIKIPDERKIWLTYRNREIRKEMEKIDPGDRAAVKEKRQELAVFFGVLPERITAIFSEEKARFPGDYDEIDKIAYKVYK